MKTIKKWTAQNEDFSPTLAEKRRMVNDEMINRLNHIIHDYDNQISILQEPMQSDAEHDVAEGDPNMELEKELKSRNITESASFQEVIEHLAAVIDYIDNTQLDSRAISLIDIELLKARRQLIVQMRNRRIGLIDAYVQYASR